VPPPVAAEVCRPSTSTESPGANTPHSAIAAGIGTTVPSKKRPRQRNHHTTGQHLQRATQ